MFDISYGEKSLKLVGRWEVVLKDKHGKKKRHIRGKNVITTNGLEFLSSFLHSATTSGTWDMNWIAIGTDATAEAASNTALGVELTRVSGSATYTSGAIYSVVATFSAGVGTGAITEYGLLSSSTGGTMLSRDTEDVINKGASDTLTVTTDITLS